MGKGYKQEDLGEGRGRGCVKLLLHSRATFGKILPLFFSCMRGGVTHSSRGRTPTLSRGDGVVLINLQGVPIFNRGLPKFHQGVPNSMGEEAVPEFRARGVSKFHRGGGTPTYNISPITLG